MIATTKSQLLRIIKITCMVSVLMIAPVSTVCSDNMQSQSIGSAITVDSNAVYIVQGNKLIKLDKQSMRVLNQTTLPQSVVPNASGSGAAVGRGPSEQNPSMDSMNQLQQMPAKQFEQSFMREMMSHHAGAIAMSKLALTKAKHPQLISLAKRIISSQSKENRELSGWLTKWYGASTKTYLMTVDEQRLQRLKSLSGRDFEVQFMRDMIAHHQTAIDMSEIAESKAEHPELKAKARQIISIQSSEIRQMRRWLYAWYSVQM